jgi:hypothetical protein
MSSTQIVHSSPTLGRRYDSVQAADAVFKLRADQVAAAKEAAKANGGDEVFYQVGQDTYVATARSMKQGAYGGFQQRFVENPYWNPNNDEIGVKPSKDAPATGLVKVVAKGYNNEFQSGSEYANSKTTNWGEWLISLFGWTHRRAWEKLEKPTYDADAFAKFGEKLEAGKAY